MGVSYTETRPGQTVLRWLSGYLPFGCADDPGSNPDAAQRNIVPGDEILASYGKSYVGRIKKAVIRQKKQQDDAALTLSDAFPLVAQGAVNVFRCAMCCRVVKKNVRRTHLRCCLGLCKA